VKPEVMVPLVGHEKELKAQKEIIVRVAEEVMAEKGLRFEYLVGTMIEVPRGALTAHEIAREAQFFSFGTNDLTQMTFGFSRDDVGKFLRGILTVGATRDWRAVIRDATGEEIGPRALQACYQPLQDAMAKRNQGKDCSR
jgi:phosphoenolpyruvate synthase/pyruvate phosphate dikinase